MKNEIIYESEQGKVVLNLRYGRSPDVEVRTFECGDLLQAEDVEALLVRVFAEGWRHKALSDAHASALKIKKMMKEVGA